MKRITILAGMVLRKRYKRLKTVREIIDLMKHSYTQKRVDIIRDPKRTKEEREKAKRELILLFPTGYSNDSVTTGHSSKFFTYAGVQELDFDKGIMPFQKWGDVLWDLAEGYRRNGLEPLEHIHLAFQSPSGFFKVICGLPYEVSTKNAVDDLELMKRDFLSPQWSSAIDPGCKPFPGRGVYLSSVKDINYYGREDVVFGMSKEWEEYVTLSTPGLSLTLPKGEGTKNAEVFISSPSGGVEGAVGSSQFFLPHPENAVEEYFQGPRAKELLKTLLNPEACGRHECLKSLLPSLRHFYAGHSYQKMAEDLSDYTRLPDDEVRALCKYYWEKQPWGEPSEHVAYLIRKHKE